MASEATHDTDFDRFSLKEDGQAVYVSYSLRDGVLDLRHTYTPPELRGRGLASKVVQAAFEYARENGLKVKPTCTYVQAYVGRHGEYESLLVDS